jgi:hypothetical protein
LRKTDKIITIPRKDTKGQIEIRLSNRWNVGNIYDSVDIRFYGSRGGRQYTKFLYKHDLNVFIDTLKATNAVSESDRKAVLAFSQTLYFNMASRTRMLVLNAEELIAVLSHLSTKMGTPLSEGG